LGRTLVVGDLHGCYDELVALLDAAKFGAEDRVVCVGDLVTKGDKSREALELFMADARFTAVLGNHDRALLAYWRGRVEKKQLKPAQKKCAKELKEGRDAYAAFLETLPTYVDLGSHVVVHAGLRPGVALEDQTIEDLTELRTLGEDRASREGKRWYKAYDGEKFALFGHWPAKWPRRGPRALGLDTGCVYGNRLTAYVVETGAIHSVPALRAYDTK
jgi:predicted MPP superfamily phosphohydrolase